MRKAKYRVLNIGLGARVRAARLSLRWNLGDLSRVTGLSRSHLCKVENGSTTLSLRTLAVVARALGRSIVWLVEPLNQIAPGGAARPARKANGFAGRRKRLVVLRPQAPPPG